MLMFYLVQVGWLASVPLPPMDTWSAHNIATNVGFPSTGLITLDNNNLIPTYRATYFKQTLPKLLLLAVYTQLWVNVTLTVPPPIMLILTYNNLYQFSCHKPGHTILCSILFPVFIDSRLHHQLSFFLTIFPFNFTKTSHINNANQILHLFHSRRPYHSVQE